jgi:hypothetical protein
MGLDLDETAGLLTKSDVTTSIYIRAVRLFEFQTWLYCPKPPNETIQKYARLLAAIKLLEYLERDIRAKTGEKFLSLMTLAGHPSYAEVFDVVIAKSGGLRKILRLWNAREFDQQIERRLSEAKTVAKFIDFSYRFARLKSNDKQRGGVTMARFVVGAAHSYNVKLGTSTLKSRWWEYSPSSGFLYLVHIQKFELKPLRVSTNTFAEKLLAQAADRDHLIEFFQAHRHLAEILKPRGYLLPTISPDVGTLGSPLAVDPFPVDVDSAIKRYAKDGPAA